MSNPPGPKGLPVLGNFFDIQRDALGFLQHVWCEYGDTSRFQLGPHDLWLIVHPKDIHRILVEKSANYEKNRLYESLKPIVGNGVLASNGERWVKHRKLLRPMFHRRVLDRVVARVSENAKAMVGKWLEKPRVLNVGKEMSAHALANVGDVLFGGAFEDERVNVGLPHVLQETHKRLYKIVKPPLWFPTGVNRQFNRRLRGLHDFVDEVIEERSKRPPKEDLAGLIFGAVATGHMTLADARAEIMTVIMAGHETTGLALTWFWYEMGRNPEVYSRVVAECRDLESDPGDLGVEVVGGLPYLQACLWEALRMYPPTWWYGRAPIEADEVAGYRAEAGQILSISPYLTNRHPEFWEDPEDFRPERWIGKKSPPRDGRFLTFALGPRRCAGEDFALVEMAVCVASVLRRVDVQVDAGAVPLVGGIQLRPGRTIEAQVAEVAI